MQQDYIELDGHKYTFKGSIGVGTFGEVFLASNQQGEKFAIKKITDYKKSNVQQAVDAQINLQQMFKGKKYVIQCLGKQVQHGSVYIVFQLGECSLKSKMDIGLIRKKEFLKMLKDLCEGIKTLHSDKVIHRDIKPENIIYKQGTYKITDFGTCIQNTNDGLIVGTPLYWAPQVVFESDETFGTKVDVWSIGVVAFEAYFGVNPFFYEKLKESDRRAMKKLKQNIQALTPKFTIKKVVKRLYQLNYDQKAQYIEMRLQSTQPQLINLIQIFFQAKSQVRQEVDFFYVLLETMPQMEPPKKITLLKSKQDVPFDVNLFAQTLNLFYEINDQLRYYDYDDVEHALQMGLWFISQTNYPGTKFIEPSLLKSKGQKLQSKQCWILIQEKLFNYYTYLKEQVNVFFEHLNILKFKVLTCCHWRRIFLKDKEVCAMLTKISGIQIDSLMKMIDYADIYNGKQLSEIQHFITTEMFEE